MQRADVYGRRYDESTQQTNANTCPECGGRVTMNQAETVCDDCGLVLAEGQIDTGPEWRTFDDQSNRARTGAPRTPSRHDRGLSTEIGWETNGRGTALSRRKRGRLSRMRREHRRSKCEGKRERNERLGLTEIRRMTGALGIDDGVRDRACRQFSTAQHEDLLRGRSIEGMAAGALNATCRCEGRPVTLDDVASVAKVTLEKVRMAYGVLNRELGLPAKPVEAEQYLPRFVSELGLPTSVERTARSLLSRDGTPDTTGSHPGAVAGGAILVALEHSSTGESRTQETVADAADVCIVSVRKHRDALQALE